MSDQRIRAGVQALLSTGDWAGLPDDVVAALALAADLETVSRRNASRTGGMTRHHHIERSIRWSHVTGSHLVSETRREELWGYGADSSLRSLEKQRAAALEQSEHLARKIAGKDPGDPEPSP